MRLCLGNVASHLQEAASAGETLLGKRSNIYVILNQVLFSLHQKKASNKWIILLLKSIANKECIFSQVFILLSTFFYSF